MLVCARPARAACGEHAVICGGHADSACDVAWARSQRPWRRDYGRHSSLPGRAWVADSRSSAAMLRACFPSGGRQASPGRGDRISWRARLLPRLYPTPPTHTHTGPDSSARDSIPSAKLVALARWPMGCIAMGRADPAHIRACMRFGPGRFGPGATSNESGAKSMLVQGVRTFHRRHADACIRRPTHWFVQICCSALQRRYACICRPLAR